MTNPNRLRSLAGMFGANHWAFHSADGRGYDFLADMIIAADKLNPQIAARMVPPFGRWRRFEPKRAAMMRAALERIVATPVKGRVRAGLEEPRLKAPHGHRLGRLLRAWRGLAADPLGDVERDLVGGAVEGAADARPEPSDGTVAVKRRVSTRLPPSVASEASYTTIACWLAES